MVFLKEKNLPPPKKYFFYLFSMQLFSADAMVFSKKNIFGPEKVKKRASKVAHNRPRPFYFRVQSRPTAKSPELILHIKKSRDQRSVLLSVLKSSFEINIIFRVSNVICIPTLEMSNRQCRWIRESSSRSKYNCSFYNFKLMLENSVQGDFYKCWII